MKTLYNLFKKAGYDLWEVGGSIRDSLLGKTPSDLDYTTNATPEQIKEIVNELGSVYTIGEKFGTIGIFTPKGRIEITTYRTEKYDGISRKPRVNFTPSIEEDLARRDFTINAIASNGKNVVDPFNGREDIKNKIVRCVGDEIIRFNEDPLRMLRAVRFACQLDFSLNVNIEHPEWLTRVSKERIRDEFIKILLTPQADRGVRLLCEFGLMTYIIPDFMTLKNVSQGKNHIKDAYEHSLLVLQKAKKVETNDNLVFRLASLLHDLGKPETKTEDEDGVHFYNHHSVGATKAGKILRILRFNNDTITRVTTLIKNHMAIIMLNKEIVDGKIKRRTLIRLVQRVGEDNIQMLLELVKCDVRSSSNPRYQFITELSKMIDNVLKDKPSEMKSPLNGHEIMQILGLSPSVETGKKIAEIKQRLTDKVISGELKQDDKEGAKGLL